MHQSTVSASLLKPVSRIPVRVTNALFERKIISVSTYLKIRHKNINEEAIQNAFKAIKSSAGTRSRISSTGCLIVTTESAFSKIPLVATNRLQLERECENSEKAWTSDWRSNRLDVALSNWSDTTFGYGITRPLLKASLSKFVDALGIWEAKSAKYPIGQLNDSSHKEIVNKGVAILNQLTQSEHPIDIHTLSACPGPIGPTHGDYTVRNILQVDDAHTSIDMDRFSLNGFAWIDLIHLIVDTLEKSNKSAWPHVIAELCKHDKTTLNLDAVSNPHGSTDFVRSISHDAFKIYFLVRVAAEWDALSILPIRWVRLLLKSIPFIFR